MGGKKKRSLHVFKPAPLKPPAGIFSADIIDLSDDGRGVARRNNKTVFIAGALPGEQVTFQYLSVHKQFDEGTLREITRVSPERVTPPCVYYPQCGGCDLQHVHYAAQLRHKDARLQRQLSSLVDAKTQWLAPLSAEPYGYRHRIRLAVQARRGECVLGFRRSRSHDVVDIERCVLADEQCNAVIPAIRRALQQSCDRNKLREVELSLDADGLVSIGLQLEAPMSEEGAAPFWALTAMASIAALYQRVNGQSWQRLGDSAGMASRYALPLWNVFYRYYPGDFTQVNTAVNTLVIEQVLEWLDIDAGDSVIDYFCGLGNFSLPIARSGASVTGYEWDAGMVARAEENAFLNQLASVRFRQADLFTQTNACCTVTDKVVLDPPRAGAYFLCQSLAQWRPQCIVYVSCNPATFARDAAVLRESGYSVSAVRGADMFAQTRHLELMALLRR